MEKRKWTQAEIEEYRKAHGAVLYCNREDSNLFVRKAYGIGFTLNWANPVTWVVVSAVVLFIVIRKYML